MRWFKWITRAAPVFLLGVAGCTTTTVQSNAPIQSEAAPPAQPAPAMPPQPTAADKRVSIDPELSEAIHVVKVTSSTSGEGYLKLQLDVQNARPASQRFSYIIDWLDGNGDSLSLATSFPWMLQAHETSPIVATAPTPLARDFRVTFQRMGD